MYHRLGHSTYLGTSKLNKWLKIYCNFTKLVDSACLCSCIRKDMPTACLSSLDIFRPVGFSKDPNKFSGKNSELIVNGFINKIAQTVRNPDTMVKPWSNLCGLTPQVFWLVLFYFSEITLFKASALWADAFYKSKCPSVCPSVCLSVCPSVHFWGTV